MVNIKNYVTFENGQRMPLVGLGTWQASDEEVKKAVNYALEAGYRHIDTAYNYLNEGAIGEVLQEWFKSGRLKREELFVTTKLPLIGNSADRVEKFLKLSLQSLKLDYVDLYLIHFPVGFHPGKDDKDLLPRDSSGRAMYDKNTDIIGLWKGMELQVDAGRAKSIGLSNFNSQQIERIVHSARIKPANLQVELHLYFQQKPLREVCRKHGITVCAYGPLGSRGRVELYVHRGLPEPIIPGILEDPVVLKIAQAHSKTPAQVVLRHLIQQDIVVIPKSGSKTRIEENFGVFDFTLSDSEMKSLNDADKNLRTFDFLIMGDVGKSRVSLPYSVLTLDNPTEEYDSAGANSRLFNTLSQVYESSLGITKVVRLPRSRMPDVFAKSLKLRPGKDLHIQQRLMLQITRNSADGT